MSIINVNVNVTQTWMPTSTSTQCPHQCFHNPAIVLICAANAVATNNNAIYTAKSLIINLAIRTCKNNRMRAIETERAKKPPTKEQTTSYLQQWCATINDKFWMPTNLHQHEEMIVVRMNYQWMIVIRMNYQWMWQWNNNVTTQKKWRKNMWG